MPIQTLISSDGPPLGVVPILIGPLQALLALLPVILLALFSMFLAMFRPRNVWLLLKLLWRQKMVVVVVAGLGAAVWAGAGMLPGGTGQDASVGAEALWPTFRGGDDRRGFVPGAPEPTAPGVKWVYRPAGDAAIYSSPAVVGDYVYFATARISPFDPSGSGEVLCLNAHTGELVWRGGLSDLRATFSSPVIQGNHLAIGEGLHLTRDARLSVFDSRSGALQWTFRTQSHAESTPVIAGDRVFVGAGRDGYRGFRLQPNADGEPQMLWHAPGERYMDASGSPGWHSGRVYVPMGRWGGRGLACLDAATGREHWRVPTPYPVFSGPTIVADRNLVLIGMGNGNFVQSAEQSMPSELNFLRDRGATDQELESARQRLGDAGEVWAIDLQTGEVRWRFTTQQTVLGQVAAGEDAIFAVSRDGHVYRLDYAGSELRRWNGRAPIIASPAVANEHVYVVTTAGILYCLEARSLRVAWEMPLQTEPVAPGDLFISSPVVAHGHVFVGTPRSGLLAVGEAGIKPAPLWSMHRGSPGGGGVLGNPLLPEEIELRWFQEWAGATVVTGPPALHEQALFLPQRSETGTGLACWSIEENESSAARWFFATDLPILSSPVTDGRTVFISTGRSGDSGHRLTALDAATGRPRWDRPLSAMADGDLHLTERLLLAADESLRGIDTDSGQMLWEAQVQGPASAGVQRHGRIIVASSGSAYLLDEGTGSVLWSAPLPAGAGAASSAPPVFMPDHRIVLAAESAVVVLSEVDGSLVAVQPILSPPVDPMMVLGEQLVGLRQADGQLTLLDLDQMKVVHEVANIDVAALADESAVHVMGRRGWQRIALDGMRSTGWLRWEEDEWGAPTAPPAASGRGIVFVTDRGIVVAHGRSDR